MNQNFTRYAFSDSARAMQERYGSRKSYAKTEESDRYLLTSEEKTFIAERDGFYLSTVGENGWPYVQFRGGPPGFLKVLDEQTMGYADFRGNRQFISMGNIQDTARVALMLMDYPRKQRLKIWAEATMAEAEDDPVLVERLRVPGYKAQVERAIVMKVVAFDWNCPQHIPQRFTLDEIASSPALMKQVAEMTGAL